MLDATRTYDEGKTEAKENRIVINPIPINESIYYKRAAKQIGGLEKLLTLKIRCSDIPFFKLLCADRVKCATEWMMLSDDYELHESDLSVFTELLADFESKMLLQSWRSSLSLSLSLYKVYHLIGALEIQAHVSMYNGNRKEYLLACKYLKEFREHTKNDRADFYRISEIHNGLPKLKGQIQNR